MLELFINNSYIYNSKYNFEQIKNSISGMEAS